MSTFTIPCKIYPGKNLELPCIFLAASYSNSMKNKGPKFMFRTANGFLGERMFKNLTENYEMLDPIICVGHEAREIYNLDLGVKMVENARWEDTNEIEQLRLCLNIIPKAKRVLIVQSDSLFELPKIRINQSSLMYGVYSSKEIGLNVKENFLMTTGADNERKEFDKKPAGPLYLEGNELEILRKYCNSPRNQNAELWEFYKRVHDFGGLIYCYEGQTRRYTTASDLEILETL
jgi:hypothetical protein